MGCLRLTARPETRPSVVMVGPKTFPPVIGGIETHVHEVSVRLASRGHDVIVIVPRTSGQGPRETVRGVRIIRVPSVPTRYTLKLSSMPFIAKELKRVGGAIVHAHDATGGFAAASVCDPKRFVYTMHGLGFHESDWPTPFRQGIGIMQRRALRAAAHVFCTDARTMEAVRRLRDQAEVLSSGVDPARFDRKALPRPSEYEIGAFTVLWVGRLAKVKGIEAMLDALRLVDDSERRGMRFVFIGDGPYKEDLLKAARSVREIKFLGQVEHSRIAPYVAHADMFVLPSLSEGLPISLLEAMAAGVPAVATDVGGISSQIDRDALLLIPPGNPNKLAEAMRLLHRDRAYARSLGERGKARVSARFSWDGIVDRIEAAYERLSAP